MIGRLWCRLGFHAGQVEPAHRVPEYDGDRASVFVCGRCGEVIE